MLRVCGEAGERKCVKQGRLNSGEAIKVVSLCVSKERQKRK